MIRNPILMVEIHLVAIFVSKLKPRTQCIKRLNYRLDTAESKLVGLEWHLIMIAHGIRNALTIRFSNDVSNSQL